MNQFFNPTPENLFLSEEESRHCIGAKRLKKDDLIEVTDGKGNVHLAQITTANAKRCDYQIVSTVTHPKRDAFVHLIMAPPKNSDRIEWFIEKATEIGVDKLSFIHTTYSERKKIRLDRFEKIAIGAIKQSKNPFLPIIEDIVPFTDCLFQENNSAKFIAHLDENTLPLKRVTSSNPSYTILIGPEGGFSEEEFQLSQKNGYTPITLGQHILRTETAGVVACQTIQSLYGNHNK